MSTKISWSKEEVLAAATKLNSIKQEHEANINKMRNLINELNSAWYADSKVAYEECFNSMTSTFQKYSQLLEDYSSTLTRVTNNTFSNDSQHASEIRAQFGA